MREEQEEKSCPISNLVDYLRRLLDLILGGLIHLPIKNVAILYNVFAVFCNKSQKKDNPKKVEQYLKRLKG